MRDDIIHRYTVHLSNLVGVPYKEYSKLFDFLMDQEFIYYIPGDKNRIDDGYYQRLTYMKENDISDLDFEDKFTSVLEVLVAFAIRIDHDWIGDPDDPRPDIIFVEMLENLDIFYDNSSFYYRDANIKISNWLSRLFDRNGVGSIFPLKQNVSRIDQRKVEIWMQMTAYLRENY